MQKKNLIINWSRTQRDVYVCAYACVSVFVSLCAHVHLCACLCVCGHVHALGGFKGEEGKE